MSQKGSAIEEQETNGKFIENLQRHTHLLEANLPSPITSQEFEWNQN